MSNNTEALLPCELCGVKLTLQGDHNYQAGWNWWGHPNPEESNCLLARHKIDTMPDMQTPIPADALRWNTRSRASVAAVAPERCKWCEQGDLPMFLDNDGTRCDITHQPGVLSHAHEECWWPCLRYGFEIHWPAVASSPAPASPQRVNTDFPFDDYCAGGDCRACTGVNCTCQCHAPIANPESLHATCRRVWVCKRCGNCLDHCQHKDESNFHEDLAMPCSAKTPPVQPEGEQEGINMSDSEHPITAHVDEYVKTLQRSADATEREKTLVIGNLRGFAAHLAAVENGADILDDPRVDKELSRWQEAIRHKLIEMGAPDWKIDGAGCDSGDPLDFTLAEVGQGCGWFIDQLEELHTATPPETPSATAMRAAEEVPVMARVAALAEEINALVIAEMNRQFYGPSFDRLCAIITRHLAAAPTQSKGEQWCQGMKDAAKEVCDACSNEKRYGPARKIEGSTRWWHGEHADFQCQAAGIWFALEATAAATTPEAPVEQIIKNWEPRINEMVDDLIAPVPAAVADEGERPRFATRATALNLQGRCDHGEVLTASCDDCAAAPSSGEGS